MAGYTRQDTTGQLANGNPIDADVFNDEYDAIEGAFNASTGHNHDGTTGGGAPIESIGPSQELEVTGSSVFPKVDNLIDSGKSTLQWRNGYFGTDVIVGQDVNVTRDVSIGRNLTVTGDATIEGNLILGDAASDTVNFVADVSSDIKPDTGGLNLGSSSQQWENLYLDGTANVDFLTVDEDATITGDLAVVGATGIDGDFDVNTTMFTIAAATGNTAIAGTLGVADVVSVLDTTGSTGIGTGAVVVSGGVGIAENLNVGGTLDVTGDVTLVNIEATGTADITGAMGVDGNFDVGTSQFTVDASNGNTGIAGTLDVTGDTTVENLIVNGNTTLGDAATDTIALTGVVSTDVIPSAGTENLGSSGSQWNNLYVDGTASIDTLAVDENATVAGTLGVTGATTLSDTLAVTGTSAFTGAITASGGVTGNLNGDVTGNVDGIIGGTTPANVTGTTIQFNTGLSDGTITMTGFVDEDDMVSDSPTLIPTQQSVKAYVDAATVAASDLSATNVTATTLETTTADVETLDLGGGAGAGWVLQQNTSTNDLEFIYNGVVQAKLTSAGSLQLNLDLDSEAF